MDELTQTLHHPSPPAFWKQCLQQFIPPVCWSCKQIINGQAYAEPASPFLCSNCLIELPWSDPDYHCQQCANLTAEPNRLRCPECLENHWDLDQARGAFEYDEQMRHWILQLKFYGKVQLIPLLGRLMALSLQATDWLNHFDVLIPIPLHNMRLRKRGFNQSLLLATHFMGNMRKENLVVKPAWLQRIRATRPQTELLLSERLVNLNDAFETTNEVRNKRILLLDDVMTTGTTLNAAAHCLHQAGADYVGSLVLCRRIWDDDRMNLL